MYEKRVQLFNLSNLNLNVILKDDGMRVPGKFVLTTISWHFKGRPSERHDLELRDGGGGRD